jgi:hypothetical protein
MRNPYDVNPFFRRDLLNKWEFQNADVARILRHDICVLDEGRGRLGVVRAQAGVNVTNTSSLFFAQQDVYVGSRRQVFLRTGTIAVDTGGLSSGPVYLSASTPGGLAFVKPATAIVVGTIVDEDVVFLDLAGMSLLETNSTNDILATNEYWVTDSVAAVANRQFTTISAALTQAQSDLAAGEDIVIRVMGNQAHTLPNISNTHPVNIYNGVVFLNGATVASGASLTLHECFVTGAATLENITAYFWGCQFAQADITVNTDGAATDCEVLMYNCTGMPQFTHSSSTTVANFDLRMEGCAFRNSSILPNPSLVQCSNGTVIMIGGSLSSEAGADPGFVSSAPAGKSTTFLFYDTNFNYPDDAQLISDTGTVAPTVQFNGSRIRTGASGVGVAHTTDGMPIIDIGDRAGARVSQDPSESLRPTYEAGRSLAIYSPACGLLLGHAAVIELFADTHNGEEPAVGVAVANGSITDIPIPDGEIWRLQVTRISFNGSTLYSDERFFLVRNNSGTITIQKSDSALPYDPRPVPPSTISSAYIDVVVGTGATFRVATIDEAGSGWQTQLTVHITGALGKAAM